MLKLRLPAPGARVAQDAVLMLEEADVLSRWSLFNRMQGNYPEAARHLERSLEIYHRFKQPAPRGDSVGTYGAAKPKAR
jgi:hypothetical protein